MELREAIDAVGTIIDDTNVILLRRDVHLTLVDAAKQELARREKEAPRVTVGEMVELVEAAAGGLLSWDEKRGDQFRAAAALLRRLQEFKDDYEAKGVLGKLEQQRAIANFVVDLP